jgi:hypothetical protein
MILVPSVRLADADRLWMALVKDYTRRDLTFSKDKLPALARTFKATSSSTKY